MSSSRTRTVLLSAQLYRCTVWGKTRQVLSERRQSRCGEWVNNAAELDPGVVSRAGRNKLNGRNREQTKTLRKDQSLSPARTRPHSNSLHCCRAIIVLSNVSTHTLVTIFYLYCCVRYKNRGCTMLTGFVNKQKISGKMSYSSVTKSIKVYGHQDFHLLK